MTQASELIYRRILSVETQIENARREDNRIQLTRLEGVRQAYVVDLMDVLNDEGRAVSRRSTDKFTPLSLPGTEEWIISRKEETLIDAV